jgi:hypothetical protein
MGAEHAVLAKGFDDPGAVPVEPVTPFVVVLTVVVLGMEPFAVVLGCEQQFLESHVEPEGDPPALDNGDLHLRTRKPGVVPAPSERRLAERLRPPIRAGCEDPHPDDSALTLESRQFREHLLVSERAGPQHRVHAP